MVVERNNRNYRFKLHQSILNACVVFQVFSTTLKARVEQNLSVQVLASSIGPPDSATLCWARILIPFKFFKHTFFSTYGIAFGALRGIANTPISSLTNLSQWIIIFLTIPHVSRCRSIKSACTIKNVLIIPLSNASAACFYSILSCSRTTRSLAPIQFFIHYVLRCNTWS